MYFGGMACCGVWGGGTRCDVWVASGDGLCEDLWGRGGGGVTRGYVDRKRWTDCGGVVVRMHAWKHGSMAVGGVDCSCSCRLSLLFVKQTDVVVVRYGQEGWNAAFEVLSLFSIVVEVVVGFVHLEGRCL